MNAARTWVGLLALLLAGSAPAAEDYLPSGPLHEAGLVKFWQLQLPLEPDQQILDLYLVDDQLYATTQDGYAFAVDAPTGALRWMCEVTHGGYRVTVPAHAGDRTIFVTPAMVLHFDRYFGTPILRFDLRVPAASPPASDGRRVFFGAINQRFYAYSGANEFERWRTVSYGTVSARATLAGGVLFFAGESGHVFACTPSNKTRVWVRRPGGPVTADLVADENGVYVASRDNSLYLLDPVAGGTRWQARLSGPLYEPPAITKDVVYQYCPDDGVVAISTAPIVQQDRILWRMADGRRVLTSDDAHVYVLSTNDEIRAVRIADGTVTSVIPAIGFNKAVPVMGGKVIFLAANDGRLFCARGSDAGVLTREQVLAALRVTTGKPPPPAPEPPAASRPAATQTQDVLKTGEKGPPIGGKSRVSKQYGGG